MLIQITTTTQHSISKEQNKKHRGACIFCTSQFWKRSILLHITHNCRLSFLTFTATSVTARPGLTKKQLEDSLKGLVLIRL